MAQSSSLVESTSEEIFLEVYGLEYIPGYFSEFQLEAHHVENRVENDDCAIVTIFD